MNIMIIGAHPDDAEGNFGGAAILYRARGHRVMMLSMTNGDSGHHIMGRKELAARRRKEARNAAGIMDVECRILPLRDGELVPSVANRKKLLRIIRQFKPDTIFTHSSEDYHPDHRYTNQLVIDTSYMTIVPNALPGVPPLKENPCYFYFSSGSPRKGAFNFCIPVDSVWDKKLLAWHQHESQMYEWLPWTMGILKDVPADEKGRLKFLNEWRGKGQKAIADNYRQWLRKKYGAKSEKIKYAEAVYSAPVGRQVYMKRKEIEDVFPC